MPKRPISKWKISASLLLAVAGAARGQTSVGGGSLALKSLSSATLSSNGYVGTYLTVPAGGATVNFTVNATAPGSGTAPHMNLVIADTITGFAVNNTSATDYSTGDITLPAGTFFVRNERDYNNNVGVSRSFTVNTLSVNTVSGSAATFNNSSTDANAIAASNTYIDNYRKGNATVALSGPNGIPLLAGTQVQVYTGRNAFNFGGTASGSSLNDSKDMLAANPTAGTEAYKFQRFINTHFNMIVPSNGGKWSNNEATQNSVNMTLVDRQLNYAQSHNMRARMHNLIWGSGATSGSQQPTWVNTLITAAAGGNTTSKASLSSGITSRTNYYAGTTGNRSQKYVEVDVLNEALHNPSYWNIYGPSGVAGIYNQMASAITAAGSNAKTYLNEYNVLQFSPASVNSSGVESGSDGYAKYYQNEIEAVRNAGGNVGGIGIQEYAQITTATPSAATAQQALQNLSTQGLPITMAEFGMASGTTQASSAANGPAALETAMRMMYGTPQATSFMIWGWWDLTGAAFPPAALLDNTTGTGANAVLTPMGTKWESLLSQWTTNQAVTLAPDGTISFNGFYGDYYLSGQNAAFANVNNLAPNSLPFDMTLTKGTTSYSATLAKPPNWYFWKTNGSGTWGTSSNWTDAPESGVAPSGAGTTAYFGGSASSRNLNTGVATTVNITNPVTVSIASPVTAGMLVFDSAGSYTINGSAIGLQGYNNANGHAAAIYVNAGNPTINAPLTFLDNTTATVAPAGSTLTISSLQSSSSTLAKNGAGTLLVNNLRSAGLAVSAGTVRVMANGAAVGVSNVASLSVAAGAKLDLSDNKLVTGISVGTAMGGIYDGISGLVQSGRNGGNWAGSGIVTSQTVATTSNITSLGVASARDVKGIAATETAVFAGQTVTGSDTLVMYTYGGDANLDGKINVDDYTRIDFNVPLATPGWYNGDFNYDGKINVDDYTIIDFNIGVQGAPFSTADEGGLSAIAIPEPAAGVVWVAAAALASRRRRR